MLCVPAKVNLVFIVIHESHRQALMKVERRTFAEYKTGLNWFVVGVSGLVCAVGVAFSVPTIYFSNVTNYVQT